MKRLEFGKKIAEKTAILSNFTKSDWQNVAQFTKFFVFPFRQASDPTKPDLVTFSWKQTGSSYQPVITVASTDEGLINPSLKIPSCKSTSAV